MLLYEKLVNHQILTRSHYTFIPVQDNAIFYNHYKRENPRSISTSGIFLSLKRRLPTLPHVRSTIGVTKLNFSVRNGKRWNLRAIVT